MKVREANVYDDENVLQNVSKEDIHKALMVLSLRDVMVTDDTFSMNRILLHIQNEYDIRLTKGIIQNIIEDSKQLVSKVKDKVIDV